MSATIIIAKQLNDGQLIHIAEVDTSKRAEFVCCDCGQKLTAIKTNARKKDWHFRHPQKTDIAICRSTALHDFAVQILMENSKIKIEKFRSITYSNPRKEVVFFSKRSDVTVKYYNEDVHFEVYVTHDLDEEKLGIYKTQKLKCVKINLSNPQLLTALPKNIEEAVLNDYSNKLIIYWNDQTKKTIEPNVSDLNCVKNILITIAVFLGVMYIIKWFKKRRHERYY